MFEVVFAFLRCKGIAQFSKPNVVFLPYKAALLLSASRATVNIVPNVTGGSTIASGITPPTTDFEGIPFVPTDSIKIGEKKW